ncbi:MAG: hypothetical protein ACK4HL_07615 [Aestuariivirga sp.]
MASTNDRVNSSPEPPARLLLLAGFGAFAASVAGLQVLFQTLPADTGEAFIVYVHLDLTATAGHTVFPLV